MVTANQRNLQQHKRKWKTSIKITYGEKKEQENQNRTDIAKGGSFVYFVMFI